MSDILVTGATGFIGRALCYNLQRHGYKVTELSSRDGDIADTDTLNPIGPVSHVFHLAGRTFVPDSWKDPSEFQRVNVLGTTNVLEYCRKYGVHLTFVSAYLYGMPERLPISETCMPRPNNPYALTKYLAEQVCEFYSNHHGVNVMVLRPFNIFGPGQSTNFLIPKIIEQVKNGVAVRLDDLTPRRDYLYIDDLIDALLKSLNPLNPHKSYDVFNIGSGQSLSVSDVVTVIRQMAGPQVPVISDNKERINEISDSYADITYALSCLGWKPKVTFQQGIKKTIDSKCYA